MPDQRRIYGIDFSGARDAGRRIWVASGVVEGGGLRVAACHRASELPGSGGRREACLAALRDLVAGQGAAAFGLDFPFGLPRALVGHERWEDFVLAFEAYADPDAFRQACRQAAGGRELKRVTDWRSRTPFSPYNLRLYRQTYYGIRDLLGPLVRGRLACVLPMQAPRPDRPWVLEICPASTLKRQGLYRPYKGKTEAHQAARAWVLERIEALGPVSVPDGEVRSAVLADRGGDALDSLIAALAVFRALSEPNALQIEEDAAYALEGYVYV